MIHDYLPMNRADMNIRGWNQCDFVYVSGDAYVDHPSFGHAIITRLLEAHGYKVGIIAQPDWKDPESIRVLGEPRLGFFVSGGNMDSMVNHYSVSKKRRQQDSYTPGGVMGKRPDYATVVYCNLIRSVYKRVPIIIGGIEASLRRLAHYDYWSDRLKHSILIDSQADLISYGMGERSVVEIADALNSGIDIKDITFIDGTVYKTSSLDSVYDALTLPSYGAMKADKLEYARSYYIQYSNTDPFTGKRLVEPYQDNCYVVQNPPSRPLTTEEMDEVYDLPYMRNYHPSYEEEGGVPAIREIKFSLISNRGCFGACSFCALTFHQGRIIQVRSHDSLVAEAKLLTEEPDFKGYIHDVGGPTADFRSPACEKQLTKGACPNRQCLFPEPCRNLKADHSDYIELLRKLRSLPKVKKVFIRSGIRFDYVLADPSRKFLKELCLPEAIELAEYLRDLGYMPEQVQDFYPTPSTISTCMYYTGYDPRTMEKVYVPTNPHEKAMQRALIQYRNPKNYELVEEALKKAGRTDLIGYDKKCLIRPRFSGGGQSAGGKRPGNGQPSGGYPAAKQRDAKPAGKKKTIRNVHKKVKK